MQILERQRQIFRKRSVVGHNAPHGSSSAVPLQSALAEIAYGPQSIGRTPHINFAHNALAHPALFCRRGDSSNIHNLADKFMPGGAPKPVVATQDLHVGIANPGQSHADQRPSRLQFRKRLANLGQLFPPPAKTEHGHFTYRILPESQDELAPPSMAYLN